MLITDPWPDTLDDFVQGLAHLYARQVTDTTTVVWCPRWWAHPEAVWRLEAVWRAGAALQTGGPLWASVWMRDHLDPHMRRLMDPAGPWRYCNARTGHRDLIGPLPLEPRPGTGTAITNSVSQQPGVLARSL